jgi:hypothetical protein
VGSVDGKDMIEDEKKILRSAAVPDQKAVGISRSELLLLLDGFHEKLEASFEEIRTLPQTTARQRVVVGVPAAVRRGSAVETHGSGARGRRVFVRLVGWER